MPLKRSSLIVLFAAALALACVILTEAQHPATPTTLELADEAFNNAQFREAEKLYGVFGPFPASLEMNNGFRIGGLISHQFFRSYSVTFDFDGMKMYLRRKA